MAIMYVRLSAVSRSQGHSVVAAAAYRAGVRLIDPRTDRAHDFTKRTGVSSTAMLAPSGASWARDVNRVWGAAEQVEIRRNARTGRELLVALPAELSNAQNDALARRIGQDLVDAYGVAVLVAVHAPDAHGDARNRHAHILMSTRVAGEAGFGAKVRVLDDQTAGPREAQAMRARVAERINQALGCAGEAARVDARPLAEQADAAAERGDFANVVALGRSPMRHQGRAASALARRGGRSAVVEGNAWRARINAQLQTWGTARAEQLRGVVARRGARSGKALRTTRAQELRKGLGTPGRLTRATGADAALLNAQVQAQEETLRAMRGDVEAYLDRLAQAADRVAIAARADAERARIQSDRADEPEANRTVAPTDLTHFEGVQVRARAAEDRHAVARRALARAQHETAKARAAEAASEGAKPAPWRLTSRRAWAELRRRQRRDTSELERIERAAAASKTASQEALKRAAQDERAAQRGREARREAKAGTRARAVPGFDEGDQRTVSLPSADPSISRPNARRRGPK